MRISVGKLKILGLIAIIALASVLVRLLLSYDFHASALLYVGIPFVVSLLLIAHASRRENPTWQQRYWVVARNSFIVMLGSSVVLFEGFLCVLMYMPIHFTVLLLTFFAHAVYKTYQAKPGGTLKAHLIPTLIILAALEGTHPNLSFDRYNEVSAVKVVNLSISEIKDNLTKPIDLSHSRPWFLEIFPMPYRVDAESLAENDVHTIYFRYHRWFLTNTHEGEMSLLIEKVDEHNIYTKFINNDSYIATYLTLHGTHIELKPINGDKTEISLTVQYDRKLDPAWYFGPLERYGVETMAAFLITDIMERGSET